LPASLVAELFAVTKDSSPEFFVTTIGETRYVCYSTWIEDTYGLKFKRNQAQHLISFSVILTTKDKTTDMNRLRDGMLRFGKFLKFMQHTLNILKEEFLIAFERNSDTKKMKINMANPEETFSKYCSKISTLNSLLYSHH